MKKALIFSPVVLLPSVLVVVLLSGRDPVSFEEQVRRFEQEARDGRAESLGELARVEGRDRHAQEDPPVADVPSTDTPLGPADEGTWAAAAGFAVASPAPDYARRLDEILFGHGDLAITKRHLLRVFAVRIDPEQISEHTLNDAIDTLWANPEVREIFHDFCLAQALAALFQEEIDALEIANHLDSLCGHGHRDADREAHPGSHVPLCVKYTVCQRARNIKLEQLFAKAPSLAAIRYR